eukprot:TRINITY_DN11240_c0_g1_i1.p1 TRINITY_DN11240_c0_g1~~TRINITY_DN11240_c0_g1_i1.p1  ORF type:complete len:887 (+),score=161.57 TRINITY_DN11240_c0_g1_i1:54-2714(+)
MPAIATYLRLRPAKKPSDDFEVTEDEPEILKVKVSAEGKAGSQDHKLQYSFKFDQIFPQTITQEDIFETVGQPVCDRFLEGFNGTVFAYGQTGSGKTYTIEGGSKRFEDRGLLPRCLAYIFEALKDKPAAKASVTVTYLEIYNNTAYDLLNAASGSSARLPKVSVQDRGTSCVVHGLSQHPAPTEEVAQQLAFLGKTNRTVASTTMNLTSSRSHSVFTLTLHYQRPGSDTIIKSKLNLVDLAGSERVSKSHASGQQLDEAKHINLSLHYLENVIIALQKSTNKKHIPYRNSLLTKLLRDSLGGNCITAMIAAISLKDSNKHESISTCRFAQRVAMVDNDARRNEVLDDKTVIKRLRRRVAELQTELKVAQEVARDAQGRQGSSEDHQSALASDGRTVDRNRCIKAMKAYVHGKLGDPLSAIPEPPAIRVCFEVLRSMVLQQRSQLDELEAAVADGIKSQAQLQELKQKFGVTRARMRNLESSVVHPSGYGAKTSPIKKRDKRNKQRKPKSDARDLEHRGAGSRRVNPKLGPQPKARRQLHAGNTQRDFVQVQGVKRKKAPGNRSRAEKTLMLLYRKEEELQYALLASTDRVEQQRQIVGYCSQRAPHRLLAEKQRERQLEEEQAQLAAQLIEIQNGRAELEEALGTSVDAIQQPPEPDKPSRSRTYTAMEATVVKQPQRSRSTVSHQHRSHFNLSSTSRSREGIQRSPSNVSRQMDEQMAALQEREDSTRRKLAMLKQQLQQEKQLQPKQGHPQPISSAQTCSRSGTERSVSKTHRVSNVAPAAERPRSRIQKEIPVTTVQHHKTVAGSSSIASGTSSSANHSQPSSQPQVVHIASRPVAKTSPEHQTQYMSALQTQRNRVQRIRQAIKAATTIQRAWRAHKKRSK